MRRTFAPQIREQVEKRMGPGFADHEMNRTRSVPFVAPVGQAWQSDVELDVLLLTPRQFRAGDIDNRMKTLIDALKIPSGSTSSEEPDPFYCLMDDDTRVARLSVDARSWHEPGFQETDALVIVTAKIVPSRLMSRSSRVISTLLYL